MGSDPRTKFTLLLLVGFNPRSHMGSDHKQIRRAVNTLVSIHAPTWGATYLAYLVVDWRLVSIHAPTWGAT